MDTAPSKWIPVAQELPPEGEIVLTKIQTADGNRTVRYMHRHETRWYWGGEWRAMPPTHWARD